MPSRKTECTELSVAFGILNVEPVGLTQQEIQRLMNGTLSFDKYTGFVEEFQSDKSFYREFYAVGVNLRSSHPIISQINLSSVQWEGPNQQASSVSMAKDIIAANISISVKAISDVVLNTSPHSLFHSLPRGTSAHARADNWYSMASGELYQDLYKYVRDRWFPDYPLTVEEFDKTPKLRKPFGRQAAAITPRSRSETTPFKQMYIEFCRDVARKSAESFNDAYKQSSSGAMRNSVLENVIKLFFRIGDSEYILCGLDKKDDFAVTIPDLSSWKRSWRLRHIEAQPDLTAEQSKVIFRLQIENSHEQKIHTFQYRVEIWWSHGKFGGNPEAKLYKEFMWTDVPFFGHIYERAPVQKYKCIGSGGFGAVYEGILKNTGDRVAIKELSIPGQSFVEGFSVEERARFKREVQIQSRLDHPNILPILASDLNARTPWFATPLAQNSLTDIISELQGNTTRTNDIFRQVLIGMHHAHQQEIVHRDLKPDNILIFDADNVMIGDFGLGKHLSESAQEAVLTRSSNNSMGSLAYAAPEQLESFRDADYRADIYALGKTLAHMLTGKPPVSSQFAVNAEYRDFVERAIREDPEERFNSIEEMLQAFDEIIASTDSNRQLPLFD